MGKEAEDSGKKAAKSSEGFTVMKGVLANLASTAITACINGLKKLGSAMVDTVKDVAAMGDSIDKASQKIGVSTDVYQQLDYALQRNGSSIDNISRGMTNITNAIADTQNGVKGASKDFDALGISLKNTDGSMKSAEDVLLESIDALASMTDETQRNAKANDIFGRSYAELKPLLNSGSDGIRALMDEAKEYGMVMSDDAIKASVDYTDAMTKMKGTLNGIKSNIVGEFLPAVTNLINSFTELAHGSEGAGEMMNKSIGTLIGSLSDKLPSAISALSGISSAVLSVAPDIISSLIEGILVSLPRLTAALVDGLKMAVSQAISQLGSVVSTIEKVSLDLILSLIDGLKTAAPQLLSELPSIIHDAIQTLYEAAPDMVSAGIELADALLTGLMDAAGQLLLDLPNLIGMAVETIATQLPRLLESGKNLILKLKDGIIAGLPEFLQSLPVIISNTVSTLVSMLPEVVQTGTELLNGLLDGLISGIPILIENLPLIIESIVTTLVDNAPLILDAGMTLLESLISGILSALPKLVAMAPKLILTLVTELVKALPRLLSLGGQLLSQLISGISKAIPKLLQTAKDIVKTVLDALKQLPEKVVEIGTNLVKGLWNGIKDAVGWIKDKIVEFGDSVLQGLKDFFGIESPSKVMKKEVGAYLAKGIGIGFTDEMKNVASQMQDSIPTSFDTSATINSTGESAGGYVFDAAVQAFKEALYQVKIEMDDEQMGRFVDSTTSKLLYA